VSERMYSALDKQQEHMAGKAQGLRLSVVDFFTPLSPPSPYSSARPHHVRGPSFFLCFFSTHPIPAHARALIQSPHAPRSIILPTSIIRPDR